MEKAECNESTENQTTNCTKREKHRELMTIDPAVEIGREEGRGRRREREIKEREEKNKKVDTRTLKLHTCLTHMLAKAQAATRLNRGTA